MGSGCSMEKLESDLHPTFLFGHVTPRERSPIADVLDWAARLSSYRGSFCFQIGEDEVEIRKHIGRSVSPKAFRIYRRDPSFSGTRIGQFHVSGEYSLTIFSTASLQKIYKPTTTFKIKLHGKNGGEFISRSSKSKSCNVFTKNNNPQV